MIADDIRVKCRPCIATTNGLARLIHIADGSGFNVFNYDIFDRLASNERESLMLSSSLAGDTITNYVCAPGGRIPKDRLSIQHRNRLQLRPVPVQPGRDSRWENADERGRLQRFRADDQLGVAARSELTTSCRLRSRSGDQLGRCQYFDQWKETGFNTGQSFGEHRRP